MLSSKMFVILNIKLIKTLHALRKSKYCFFFCKIFKAKLKLKAGSSNIDFFCIAVSLIDTFTASFNLT